MFTNKDIEHRDIFVVNGYEHRKLRVENFQLALYDSEKDICLTKIPFHKILCLFVIGDMTLTSPLIEKCNRNNIPIVVTKQNFRLVFFYAHTAEGNFLLRQRQHSYPKESTDIAKVLVQSKIENQRELLKRIRKKSAVVTEAIAVCDETLGSLHSLASLYDLLSAEGSVAKYFFEAYYGDFGWKRRMQRTKIDMLNTIMDIGYTILFHFVECMLRMFGFDLYVGVYHQLWFQRKSLVCDMVEPFRALIDAEIRKNLKYKKFVEEDFEVKQGRYFLQRTESKKYYEVFFQTLVENRKDIFVYIREYYRCFMGRKSVPHYPIFKIK